jgi:serine/threonine protein kinase
MSITDPLIGKRLGDYLIEGILGTGGMARVYRGYDDNLDRYAAIKVIEPQLIASAEEDEYRERFLREARAIARLNHPRIVGVYQFNQIGNLYYIAMDYIEGRNLRDILKSYIKQDKMMPTSELMMVLRDIADALDYAHRQSIIHRDVKPSNIIVTDEGHAVLTDFGLALNAVEGTIGNTFGSVHYIAPEQAISSAQAVPQSDQYSLGIVAYELLTGRVPFDDASAMSVALKHISDPPPPPTEINPNIPAEVEQVLLKSLDKDVNKRYTTATEFVKALEFAFSMSENQDIAPPPSGLATGNPGATKPVPPPEFATKLDKSTPPVAVKLDDSAGTKSLIDPLLAKVPQRNLIIGATAIVLLVVAVGIFLMNNIAQQNAEATATAQTATQFMVVQIAQNTETALTAEYLAAESATTAAQQISTEQAFVAQQTNTEQAVIAGHTQDAVASSTAEIRQTSIAETEVALTRAGDRLATADAIISRQTENAVATETQQAQPTLTPSITPTNAPTNTPTHIPTATNTPRPSRTPTPDILIASEADTQQVLLRYDGRLFILGNRDILNRIDISDLVFVRFEPDEEGNMQASRPYALDDIAAFSAELNGLAAGRCLQILNNREFGGLPPENPLANDLCSRNPFWTTTANLFWVSESSEAYFEVRVGSVDVLTRCSTNTPETRRELRCAVNLNLP